MGKTASLANIGSIADSSLGFRNRLINSDMRIDQRNAGASVTQTTDDKYTIDRFYIYGSVTSKFTVQQNAGSVTPPVGFIKYLGASSSSAYTVGSSEQFNIQQPIEGLNCTDLAWGTASALSVTLSFWARSSLTGTFGGSLRNSAVNRSYPFSYTISSANTWEQKSITITGDTSGTWLTTNGVGIYVNFSMGAGSTLSGTAGAWAGTNYTSATGATSVVGTNGATFYITGVQLEVGTVATSFDYRPYGTELALCQRYYYSLTAETTYMAFCTLSVYGTGAANGGMIYFPVTMRSQPTFTYAAALANYQVQTSVGGGVTPTAIVIPSTTLSSKVAHVHISSTSGLVAGNVSQLFSNNSLLPQLQFSAEL
jgi:hypothetical protein